MGSDIKPSVSITPVSSADAATLNMKKPAGIEIIPLGDKLPENESSSKKSGSGSSSGSSDSKSSSLLKEIKRSLSEDDKRRMEKKDGKKRKRDQFILKNETSPSHKKSKQYSSSNSSSGGSGGSGGSGSSSSTGSTTNKKLTSVIDRLSSSSHNDSGIEIIPRNDKIKSPSQVCNLINKFEVCCFGSNMRYHKVPKYFRSSIYILETKECHTFSKKWLTKSLQPIKNQSRF